MAKLAGKVALITGAAGGQGVAEAELFVREGAAVMLTDIDQPGGEALAQRLTGEGGRARFRALHILINNAGTIARQGIVDTSLAAWNRTIAVNLTGPLLGMKHCAPS